LRISINFIFIFREVLAEYYRIAASKVIDDAMKACIEGENIKA
jgi:hypothetical protein